MNYKLEELNKKIIASLKERGWNPGAEDLSKSIVIEAAELLEIYQWSNNKDKNFEKIGEEVADVYIYLVEFCNAVGLKLNVVVEDKIRKNEIKYPVEMFKGHHNDKFYFEQKRKYREHKNKT